MKKKIFRIFICLLVVCCLLVRISPIQAKAFGFVPGLYDIAANIGVNAALRAIGVGPGNSPDSFNQLVTDATNNLFEGLSPLTQVFLDYTENGFRAFLSADFLSRVLSFLFNSKTLLAPVGINNNSAGSAFSVGGYSFTCSLDSVSFVTDFPGQSFYRLYICVPGYSGTPNISGDLDVSYYGGVDVSGIYYRVYHASADTISGSYYEAPSTLIPNTVRAVLSGSASLVGSIFTSSDLTLDDVGSSLSDSAYSDWTAGFVTQEDQSFVPVSIPSISDSAAISTQTQAQAQAGTIPETVVDEIVAGAEVVPETGTIADVITAVRALGTDMVAAIQAIPAAIADVFTPSGTVEAYSLDLKRFFPFCIPYDIYSMLAALAADPVAPKFDFEIDLGPVGILPISVDFSEWDDVAALLRTCEAAIFAVGLAVKTKELIGW